MPGDCEAGLVQLSEQVWTRLTVLSGIGVLLMEVIEVIMLHLLHSTSSSIKAGL